MPLTCLPLLSRSLLAAALACALGAVSVAAPAADITTPPKPRITPAQARELFRSVDTILRFDAKDTGLPVHRDVKRKLLTREQVVAFLKEKMDEDKDTARIERSAIVLEKFGLLPPHFALRPFLLSLLGEQVAGFYDSKTKTVNLLDWIDADTQKPVLAHELTHALQDQYQNARGVDLDKWENAGPEGTAANAAEDRAHIRYDETNTAREAVLEGQAMVAYLDWGLDGSGRSLRTQTLSASDLDNATSSDADSPILSSAPLVLRESLLFPYNDGLLFEQKLLQAHGTDAAFADALNRPPETSYEILHPDFYWRGGHAPLLAMPDLHPLLDAGWAPYDVGVMGALDVRMLAEALVDKGAGADAAEAWDGGLYYAAQSRAAKSDAEKNDTASIALVYLSRWKTAQAAGAFAALYRGSLAKRYPGLKTGQAADTTSEGPVLVRQQDRYVFVSHSLPVPLAEQVMASMIGAQSAAAPNNANAPQASLSAPLRGFFARQGCLRTAMRPRVY